MNRMNIHVANVGVVFVICLDKIKKSQAKHIIELIEQEARAEVMARVAPFDNLEFADYAMMQIEKKDELRKYVFGTSCLIKLADIFGISLERKKHKKKKKKIRRKV